MRDRTSRIERKVSPPGWVISTCLTSLSVISHPSNRDNKQTHLPSLWGGLEKLMWVPCSVCGTTSPTMVDNLHLFSARFAQLLTWLLLLSVSPPSSGLYSISLQSRHCDITFLASSLCFLKSAAPGIRLKTLQFLRSFVT